MARAMASIEVPVSADRVWQLIGVFDSLPDWLPYIPRSELSEGGRVRRLESSAGEVIVERLEAFDNRERFYSYSFVQAPFPATGYLATIRVRELADGRASLVEWSGRFEPNGVSDEEVTQLFRGIYEAGLKALEESLAA